jgi:hypothetical protein
MPIETKDFLRGLLIYAGGLGLLVWAMFGGAAYGLFG